MRIRFYGVQGSGSTFPTADETAALRETVEYQLLKMVFEDLSKHISDKNELDRSLTQYLGGPITKKNLLKYRERFNIRLPRIYGGWTTCIHIETRDGHDIVFDCGSGFRNCAKDLQAKWDNQKQRHLHIFGSHSHYDHTEGFDQAMVCFDPRNSIHIYGNYQFLFALNSYLGIFSRTVRDDMIGVQTPINFSIMPAGFHGNEIRDFKAPGTEDKGENIGCSPCDINHPIEIGDTRITAFEVCHPAPCLAYKVEHGGKTFIYCTDHELKHASDDPDEPPDPDLDKSLQAESRLMAHAKNADAMYRDGQYLRSEYDGFAGIGSTGPVPRAGWGHSCLEDVQQMAAACRVKHTYIGHHDPNREWSERNWMDEALARSCRKTEEKIELARAGTRIDL